MLHDEKEMVYISCGVQLGTLHMSRFSSFEDGYTSGPHGALDLFHGLILLSISL